MNNGILAPVRCGLLLAFCTLFVGVYLGMHMGKNEDAIEKMFEQNAEQSQVLTTEKEKSKAASAGWKYMKRAHEHYQGLGAISVALVLVTAFTWLKPLLKRLIALGIGIGGFLYPSFWYLVAYKSTRIGAHAAKESLALVAQAGAGLYFVSFLALFAVVVVYAIWKDNPPAFLGSLKE